MAPKYSKKNKNRTDVLSLVAPHANYVTQKSIIRSVYNTNAGFKSSRAVNILKDMKPSFLENDFLDMLEYWKTDPNPDVETVCRVLAATLENGAIITKKDVLIDIVATLLDHKEATLESIFVRVLKIMETLLDQPNIDINYRAPGRMTVLLTIVNKCIEYQEYIPRLHGKLLQWCKQHGADFSTGRALRTLLFHLLVSAADKTVNYDISGLAGLLVDLGVDPNVIHDVKGEWWSDMKATTALHLCLWMIGERRDATVTALLSRGADPNIPMLQRNVKIPMLYECILEGRAPHLVPVLVDAGANPNARDSKGTPLLAKVVCTDIGPSRFGAFQLLTSLGADPRMRDASGDTVLHAILRKSRSKKVQDEDEYEIVDIVKSCIATWPTLVNVRGAGGASLLFLATKRPRKLRKHSKTVDVLLKAGATLAKDETL